MLDLSQYKLDSTPAPTNDVQAPNSLDLSKYQTQDTPAIHEPAPVDTGMNPGAFSQGLSDAGNILDKVGGGINTAMKSGWNPINWGPSQAVGLGVGALGGAIGGAVAAVGNPIKNLIQGKPVFQDWGKDVATNATTMANNGYSIGQQGTQAAPLMGAGKITGAILAATQAEQAIKSASQGKWEDAILPAVSAIAGLYGVKESDGLFINKNVFGGSKVTPEASSDTPPPPPDGGSSPTSGPGNPKIAAKFMGIDPANLTKKQIIKARTSFQTEPPTGLFGESGVITPNRNLQIAQDYQSNFNSSNVDTLLNNFHDTMKPVGVTRDALLEAHPLTMPPTSYKTLLAQKIAPVAQQIIDESANPVGTMNIINRQIEVIANHAVEQAGDSPVITLKNISDGQMKFNKNIDYTSGKYSPTAKAQIAIRNAARDIIQDQLNTLPGGVGNQYKLLIKSLSDQEEAVRNIAKFDTDALGKNNVQLKINKALDYTAGPIGRIVKKVFWNK